MTTVNLNTARGKIALTYAGAGYARDVVRDLLRDNPKITGRQVLDALEADFQSKLAAAEGPEVDVVDDDDTEIGTCKHCGQSVIRRRGDSFLTHADKIGYPTKIGCRAASFTPGSGWNDNFDRKWKATWSLPLSRK